MKRKITAPKNKSKKLKIKNATIHPLTLIFNYIDDPFEFCNTSLVYKKWKNVLDNHVFWKNLIEHLEFEGSNPKYKTYKSIFVKNVNKLCWCKKNIGEVNQDLKKIETKLSVLYDFYLDRLGFYKSWIKMKYTRSEIYYNLCNYIGEKIFNIYNQCEYKKRCNLYNNQQNILKQIQKLIDNIYEKKNSIKKINKFVVSDLIEVVIYNLKKIINNVDYLYIKRFGGLVRSWNDYQRNLPDELLLLYNTGV